MAKKGRPRRTARRKTRKPRSGPSGSAVRASRGLAELAEKLDIMVPELSARLAALEHLLVQKEICEREELIRARRFVDLPRGGFAGEEQE